jgi:hypothetical protein
MGGGDRLAPDEDVSMGRGEATGGLTAAFSFTGYLPIPLFF